MNGDIFEFDTPKPADRHESRKAFIIHNDGGGDSTVRPCPPELLAHSREVQEQIARWKAELKKQDGERQS